MIIKMETKLQEKAPINVFRLKQFLNEIPDGATLDFYQDLSDDYRVKQQMLTVTARWQEIRDETVG